MNTVVRSLSSAALVFLMSAAVATADTPDTLPPAAEPPASASSPQNIDEAASTPAESKMRSEVVFCIDCSGSMAQSLTRAQEAIAYLVDEMQAKTPDTAIRVGIIRYGTGADPLEINPLTDDPKTISNYIQRVKVTGSAEYVGMFIKNAVERMKWSNDDNVTRQIVMVGNETAFQGPIDYRQAAKVANDRGFIVSAMYCPSVGEERSAALARYSRVAAMSRTRVLGPGGSRTATNGSNPLQHMMIDVENTWLLTAYYGGGEVMKLSVDLNNPNPLLRLGPVAVAKIVEEEIPAQEARIAQADAAFAAYDMGIRPGAAPRGTGGPARMTPGVELVAGNMASDLVCIKTFAHRFEADIALSFLQAQGIPAMIDAQDLAATSPHLMLAAGGARLLVRTEDAESALEMLEADPASVDDLEI